MVYELQGDVPSSGYMSQMSKMHEGSLVVRRNVLKEVAYGRAATLFSSEEVTDEQFVQEVVSKNLTYAHLADPKLSYSFSMKYWTPAAEDNQDQTESSMSATPPGGESESI